jgi:ribosomal protein S18 acetylase RimI-like enzyme
MNNITVEVVNDGNIEQCRELCDELMMFQKSMAVIAPECFDTMNFDTRMKKSYDNALNSHVIVVKDNSIPVGYAFSTIESTEGGEILNPEWVPETDAENSMGFYPKWENFPEKIGCLSNIYLRANYRGMGIGSTLFEMSMAWLESFPDIDLTLIYVSNGNDAALKFYLDRGFIYSHEVFGGFIKALYKFKDKK